MKIYTISLCTVLILLLGFHTESKAQDGFFTDAQTLRPGTFSISVQPVVLTSSDDFLLIARVGYGFRPGLVGHLKLGGLANNNYFGGHLHYRVFAENKFAVSFIGGAHSYGDIGLKFGTNASYTLSVMSLYSGLLYQPYFGNNTSHAMMIPVGVEVPLASGRSNFIFEANISANDDGNPLEMITLGVSVYL